MSEKTPTRWATAGAPVGNSSGEGMRRSSKWRGQAVHHQVHAREHDGHHPVGGRLLEVRGLIGLLEFSLLVAPSAL